MGETGRGEVSASVFVFISNNVASCSLGSGGGDGGRLMSAGCNFAVASMVTAEGRVGKDRMYVSLRATLRKGWSQSGMSGGRLKGIGAA